MIPADTVHLQIAQRILVSVPECRQGHLEATLQGHGTLLPYAEASGGQLLGDTFPPGYRTR